MLGFVVSGEQDDALFYFGQLLFEVIDMGSLDIIHDEGDGEAIKLPCVEDLFLEDPQEGRNKFLPCTSLQRAAGVSLHDLGIEIAVFRHVLLLLQYDNKCSINPDISYMVLPWYAYCGNRLLRGGFI